MLILNYGACITSETDDGDTVEDLINQRMPNIVQNIDERNKENKDTIENKLFQLLYFESYEPGKFLEEWEKEESTNNNKVHVDADDGKYTFLQFCCNQGNKSNRSIIIIIIMALNYSVLLLYELDNIAFLL